MDDEEDYLDNEENIGSKLTISDSYVPSCNGDNNKSYSQRLVSLFTRSVSVYNNSPLSILKHNDKTNSYYRCHVSSKTLKSRRSVIKMLVVVVLIYFISFSPQVLIFILFDTNAIRSVPKFIQTPYFIAFTMLLVTISSASNPIVYAIFCLKFRQSFAKILRRLSFCGRTRFTADLDQRTRSLQQIPKRT